MKLIVGLGNPGTKYQKTRHNVGFVVVDALAIIMEQDKWLNDNRFQSSIVKINKDSYKAILAKPQTYMNESGEAVRKLADYFDIKPEDIIVVADDINLSPGIARVRKGGSDGGHNGLKSIIGVIGEDFWRVRVGVGINQKEPSESFVLKKMTAAELLQMGKTIDKVADYLVSSISDNNLKEETLDYT